MRDRALRTWQGNINQLRLQLLCMAALRMGHFYVAGQWLRRQKGQHRVSERGPAPLLGKRRAPRVAGTAGHFLSPLASPGSCKHTVWFGSADRVYFFLKMRTRRWGKLNNLFMLYLRDRPGPGPGLDLFSQPDRMEFLRTCTFVHFWLSISPDKGLTLWPWVRMLPELCTLNSESGTRLPGDGVWWGLRQGGFFSAHIWVRCLWFVRKQDWHIHLGITFYSKNINREIWRLCFESCFFLYI